MYVVMFEHGSREVHRYITYILRFFKNSTTKILPIFETKFFRSRVKGTYLNIDSYLIPSKYVHTIQST